MRKVIRNIKSHIPILFQVFVCFRRFLIQFHMSTFTKFFILSETIEFNTQKTPIKT